MSGGARSSSARARRLDKPPFSQDATTGPILPVNRGRISGKITYKYKPTLGACAIIFASEFPHLWTPQGSVSLRPEFALRTSHLPTAVPSNLLTNRSCSLGQAISSHFGSTRRSGAIRLVSVQARPHCCNFRNDDSTLGISANVSSEKPRKCTGCRSCLSCCSLVSVPFLYVLRVALPSLSPSSADAPFGGSRHRGSRIHSALNTG